MTPTCKLFGQQPSHCLAVCPHWGGWDSSSRLRPQHSPRPGQAAALVRAERKDSRRLPRKYLPIARAHKLCRTASHMRTSSNTENSFTHLRYIDCVPGSTRVQALGLRGVSTGSPRRGGGRNQQQGVPAKMPCRRQALCSTHSHKGYSNNSLSCSAQHTTVAEAHQASKHSLDTC